MFVDPYIATITNFAGNFAPLNWMFCQGQLLSIAEYNALFALIGTTYGGDGQVTFALPDLRSRVAVHQGQGPGLSNYVVGQMAGTENVTLLSPQMPAHNHAMLTFTGAFNASTATTGLVGVPNNAIPAAGATVYSNSPNGDQFGPMPCNSITPIVGGNAPLSIVQPYLAMNFIIAVEGIFPSRA
ncbi:MAG: tail fiber protein [Fluviicola sp.]|nr:tail fiber protein [Fluviicola sp.]